MKNLFLYITFMAILFQSTVYGMKELPIVNNDKVLCPKCGTELKFIQNEEGYSSYKSYVSDFKEVNNEENKIAETSTISHYGGSSYYECPKCNYLFYTDEDIQSYGILSHIEYPICGTGMK